MYCTCTVRVLCISRKLAPFSSTSSGVVSCPSPPPSPPRPHISLLLLLLPPSNHHCLWIPSCVLRVGQPLPEDFLRSHGFDAVIFTLCMYLMSLETTPKHFHGIRLMEYLTRQYPRSPSQCCLVTSWGQNPGSMSWLPPNSETGGGGVGSMIPATEGIISAQLESVCRVGDRWASGRLVHVEKAIGYLF